MGTIETLYKISQMQKAVDRMTPEELTGRYKEALELKAKDPEAAVEMIKHAAVKSKCGWIFIGKCHADCFHKMHHIKVKSSQAADDQGFITSFGRYVRRSEAHEIAVASGQLEVAQEKRVKILFSEDLWCAQDGGKLSYDEIKGYY